MRHAGRVVALLLLSGLSAGRGAVADPEIRLQPLEIVVESADVTKRAVPPDRTRSLPVGTRQRLLDRVQRRGSVRVLVELAPRASAGATSLAEARNWIAERQATFLGRLGEGVRVNRRYRSIPFVALTADVAGLRAIVAMDDVQSVSEDVPLYPLLASSNPVIGSPAAWDLGYEGDGQVVAVLDTGVDAAHPFFSALGDKIVAEACFSTTDRAENATSLCPGGVAQSTAPGSGANCPAAVYPCFHGTHVAGIAVGHDGVGPEYGVARGADVIAIQLFSRVDDADFCWPSPTPCVRVFGSDLVRGLEHVLELGQTHAIAAANLSLGGGSYTTVAECDAEHPATLAIAELLRAAGIAVVAASGNSGWRDRLVAPACLSPVVSVASTHDSDRISSFSAVATFLDLLAPGERILSAVPGGGVAQHSGTSMAAPHVAGAWALVRQAHSGAGVDQVLRALRNTATPVDDQRSNGVLRALPRINVDQALQAPVESLFFTVYNDGDAVLTVSSIAAEGAAAWIVVDPFSLTVDPGGFAFVTVDVDLTAAPVDGSRTRLLVTSDDPDEDPYPNGVFVTTPALPYCGNGIVDRAVEECDDGPDNSDVLPDACRTSCLLPSCGDAVVDAAEECDDGPDNSDTLPDACRSNCRVASCGDGTIDTGEPCDSGDGVDCGDGDGDGFALCIDCDDSDARRWGVDEWNDGHDNQCPGQVGYGLVDETGTGAGFHDPADRDAFSWPAQPGAFAYEVVRAATPAFATDCRRVTVTEPRWSDRELPSTGGAFFYLNRALSPAPGSWGADSVGEERSIPCGLLPGNFADADRQPRALPAC